ncbi:MAG: oxidoreductase [Nocardioides sp.]
MSVAAPDPLGALLSWEGVSAAYAAARDGIDARLRDRGLRRTTPEQTAESLLRGAHASAVLDGSAADLEEMRRGPADPIARAALRLSTELLALVPVLTRAPLQALARLHTLAAADLPGAAGGAGRPRDAAAAKRLQGVARLLAGGTSAPALVVAAVAHAEVATSAPFGSRDALVARALERIVLVATGVDARAVLVPEAGHLALRSAYERRLVGYRDDGRAGVHAWLLYAADAYGAGAEASPLG